MLTPEVLCRHPLNCEPPLPMLMEKGFITPVSLHYVRNHGAVPKLDWDSHKVKVSHLPNSSGHASPTDGRSVSLHPIASQTNWSKGLL